MNRRLLMVLGVLLASSAALAEEKAPEFSGPQVGEKLPPFTTRQALGDQAGKEIDLLKMAAGKPVAILFVHEVNRPSVGLARAIGNYAASRQGDGLTAGVVFLTADATETTEWLKRASGALPAGLPLGISTDGPEGPGAYGLNRNVTMTILVGKGDKVTANFALVQPSLQVDGPKIAQAIVDCLGSGQAPTAAELEKLAGPRRPDR
ncbi:MAG: hypothetical protein SFU86_25020 [Pirellulaceae bacterium]|nr:hypothetical protein [Pirellulaceae bacterium]